MSESSLEDDIYECAFVPEMWPGVLDRVAEIAGARGACVISAAARKTAHWTASPAIESVVERAFAAGDIERSGRIAGALGLRRPGFGRDTTADGTHVFATDVLYRNHLFPAGLGHGAGTAFAMPTGEALFVSVERDWAKGPVELAALLELDALRPHLARSAYLAARQQMARAKDMVDLLAQLGLPAIVMNENARVMAANDKAEALHAHVSWRAADRLALKDRKADGLLQTAMATLDGQTASTRSFVVRGDDGLAVLVAHILPLRGAARDIFARCAAVLVLTPVGMPSAPPVELVQSLFDLTPAEARIARQLVTGRTIEEIAAGHGVTYHTVRSQLRDVLAKTGCRRQAEVASLLANVTFRTME